MDPIISQALSNFLPPTLSAALVVVLARLLAIGWLKEQREFRDRVEKHMEDTRTYPDFRARMEDRSRKVYDLETRVATLSYEVAGAKADLTSLRGDVKDGMRDLKAELGKLGERLDELFKRAFGQKD